VLADGPAVLPRRLIPSLVDADGRFGDDMFRDGVRFFALPHVRRQLEAEIRAQFEAFARTGLVLDHVNAHKHFHLHPTVMRMILSVGREYGIPAVRLPREPNWFATGCAPRSGGARLAAAAAGSLLAPWLAVMQHQLRSAGIRHNDQVFGIACSGSMDESRLLTVLRRLPAGATEIYLHPATVSGAAVAPSMPGYRHAAELAALLSPRVREAIVAANLPCGGFRDRPDDG
jgi:hopanoid biosynthesis associated protein HpnK